MTVLLDNRTGEVFPEELLSVIEQIIDFTLKKENTPFPCEISISLVKNEEICQINKKFRNIEKPTDVLSFPQLTFVEGEELERNEKGEVVLGDIILSIEKAMEQAKAYGHSLTREIAFLTAHSMLHLLGYDHIKPQEEAEMFRKQEEILQLAGISRK